MIKHSKKAMNMSKNFAIILLLIFICNALPFSVSAKSVNSLAPERLYEKVTHFVNQEVNPNQSDMIKVNVVPIDSRYQLKACPEPITLELAQQRSYSRQFPVKVSCHSDESPWKTYVQVQVTEFVEALITTTHIAKGMIISDDMISIELVEKFRVKTRSVDEKSMIIGGRALRNIHPGYQIGSQDVCLVCKGDGVAIIAKTGGMTIKTSGTAIENGSFGESIRVKNNSSERIVKGIIGDLRQIYVKP
jgi:flagella basal body P-ring formation protein FlgA